MKISLAIVLLAVLTSGFVGCASEEELRRRDAEDAREDARYDADRAQRDGADYEVYLGEYARGLGKTKAQLTSAQRAEAHSRFYGRGGGSHSYRPYGYWY